MSLGSEGGVPAVMNVTPTGGTGYNNGGGWGGDWSAWIIIFVLFFAFGGWGNGFGGGWGGGNGVQGALTRADLCSEFNFNGLESAVRGVQQGFNATQVAMMQGFNAAQAQAADCCCKTQRAIDGVNYNMATNTCALQNTMNNNTRDIIDNANANSRAILDYLCQDKISTLQNENQSLRQADILRRTGAECPTPAYVVQPPTPVNFPTNCCGQFSGWGSGCGCNSGCGC